MKCSRFSSTETPLERAERLSSKWGSGLEVSFGLSCLCRPCSVGPVSPGSCWLVSCRGAGKPLQEVLSRKVRIVDRVSCPGCPSCEYGTFAGPGVLSLLHRDPGFAARALGGRVQRSPWLTRLCSAGRHHVCADTPCHAHAHTHMHTRTHTHTAVIKDTGSVVVGGRGVRTGGPGPPNCLPRSWLCGDGGGRLASVALTSLLHLLSCFSVTYLQHQKLVSGPWVLCRSPWAGGRCVEGQGPR